MTKPQLKLCRRLCASGSRDYWAYMRIILSIARRHTAQNPTASRKSASLSRPIHRANRPTPFLHLPLHILEFQLWPEDRFPE